MSPSSSDFTPLGLFSRAIRIGINLSFVSLLLLPSGRCCAVLLHLAPFALRVLRTGTHSSHLQERVMIQPEATHDGGEGPEGLGDWETKTNVERKSEENRNNS